MSKLYLRTWAAIAAEAVATLALALWAGGLVALGAFAAPQVFRLAPPMGGQTMGTIFRLFGEYAIVLMIVFAVAEGVRTAVEGLGGTVAKLRAGAAIVTVLAALSAAAWFGPRINEAFDEGVRRGVGEAGEQMERDHELAELAGKVGVFAGAAWLALAAAARRNRHVP